MKTLYFNLRLLLSGDTVLVAFSTLTFLASLANATQWPVLRAFRFCGICVLLVGLIFGILSTMEAFQHQRHKRTVVAAILFVAATLICLSNSQIAINRG